MRLIALSVSQASALQLPPSSRAVDEEAAAARAADGPPDLSEIQTYLRESLQDRRTQQPRERVMCIFEPDSEDGADRVPRVVGRADCASWRFKAGEALTVPSDAISDCPQMPSRIASLIPFGLPL